MKRKITSVFTFFLMVILSAMCLLACGKDKEEVAQNVQATVVESTDTLLVIKVDKAEETTTLWDIMQWLREEEAVVFESENSTYGEFITSINGRENGDKYWLSYTSDTEFSNEAWGTFEYQGERLGSCTLGASSMPVKEGCLYVWAYE